MPTLKASVPKRTSNAGWLLWVGVIGVLSALAAGIWLYRQSQEKPMQPPAVNANQLGDAVSEGKTVGSSGQATIAELLKKAEARERNGDLVIPEDDCAAKYYLDVLALEPNNPSALVGLEGVAGSIEEQLLKAMNEGTQAKARALLDAALKHFPDRPSFKDMNQKFQ